jgi:hypothetical protein
MWRHLPGKEKMGSECSPYPKHKYEPLTGHFPGYMFGTWSNRGHPNPIWRSGLNSGVTAAPL